MWKFLRITLLLGFVGLGWPALVQGQTLAQDTVWGEFPSVVLIKTPDLNRYCVGTVIHTHHVLTSGSCVMDFRQGAAASRIYPARLVRVMGGDISITPVGKSRQTRVAQHIFVHENFRVTTGENDLAVIRLIEPFHLPSNTLEVATMRMRITPNSQLCYWVTWLPELGATPQTLPRQQKVSATVHDRDQCNLVQRTGAWEILVQEEQICTLWQNTNNGLISPGDPLFCGGELTAVNGLSWPGTGAGAAVSEYLIGTQVRFASHWIQAQFDRTQPMPAGWNPYLY
ncbi:serine/threonine-protein kinase rio1 [Anopheles darlingi]|uniref:Serine/threonine-protein kinase rio1 n=1 Tax=Anopheles darlingi TaxID=43151 RepID=W5J9B0_ANODA|nr:serine/threonine-protein kinase rio1 [Anopheles darlingi]